MPDRRVLTEQLVHAFRASLTDANLASGYDSANMQIARVFAAGIADVLHPYLTASRTEGVGSAQLNPIIEALDLLGKQVDEHNRFLQTFKEPAPQTREARWGCYCGAVNTDRTCYVCGRVGAN